MAFEENRGQFDPSVRFLFKARNGRIWITNKGLVFDVTTKREGTTPAPNTVGARPTVEPTDRTRYVFASEYTGGTLTDMQPSEPIEAVTNYISADSSKGMRAARSYKTILVRSVWKGIDLRLIAKGNDVEQEFILAPGAQPDHIRVAYRGATRLRMDRGSLELETPIGVLREETPRAYQQLRDHSGKVDVAFKITGRTSYAFSVGSYDSRYPLVIDPPIQFSTFLGGENGDRARGVTVDDAGGIYVVGYTNSSTFPTTIGQSNPEVSAAFITKLNQTGTAIVFSTYIQSPTPGSDASLGEAIAVDHSRNIYIAGFALIQVNGYPTTPSAFQHCGIGVTAFVTKLSPSGDSMLYSSCIGPNIGHVYNYTSQKLAIAVDGNERAYVVGVTICGYPTTADALQPTCHPRGNEYEADASLAIFDTRASGTASLVYSTYLGGSWTDFGTGIALDGLGNVYVSGATRSADFPTTPTSYQPTVSPKTCQYYASFIPCNSGFVVKLNPALPGPAGLIYSTHLASGGFGTEDFVFGLAIDTAGNAYLTGQTNSASFPTTQGAFQPTKVGPGTTAFVTKLAPSGATLSYSTYLGGGGDVGYAISVDDGGNAYVTGSTGSSAFPIADADQSSNAGGIDVFVTELNAIGSAPIYSTYWGGAEADQPFAMALDSYGNVTVAGTTMSDDFPTQVPLQAFLLGSADAFVFRIGPGVPSDGPNILKVWPPQGGNAGSATISLAGDGFATGASVSLNCPDQAPLAATGVTVSPGGGLVTATFNLTGRAAQKCDLVVTNPDGGSVTKSQAFTIVIGGAPQIWVDILGWNSLRAGRPQRYFVMYGNRGDIDATNVVLSISVPVSVTFSIPDDQLVVDAIEDHDNGQVVSVAVPIMGAGGVGVIPISVKAPDDPLFAHLHIKIRAQHRILSSAGPSSSTVSATLASGLQQTSSAASAAPSDFFRGLLFAPHVYDGCARPTKVPCPNCDGKWDNLQIVEAFALNQQATYQLANVNFSVGDGTHRGAFEVAGEIGAGVVAAFALGAISTELVAAANIAGVTEGAAFSIAVNSWLSLVHDGLKGALLNRPNFGEQVVFNVIAKRTQADLVFTNYLNKIGVIKDQELLNKANSWLKAIGILQGILQNLVAGYGDLIYLWDARQQALSAFMNANNNLLCGAAASYLQCTLASCGHADTTPPPPDVDDDDLDVEIITSADPNDKFGSLGVDSLHYVPAETALGYGIFFTNKEAATAAAQDVVITDQLDLERYDISTFRLGPMAFSERVVSPSPAATDFTTTVDLRPTTNLLLKVAGHLDLATGLISWQFTSLDPLTNLPPEDPTAGFLPPGAEGSVFFTVMAKQGLATGTPIRNQAAIVFDANPPIATQVWTNTLDDSKPMSQVLPLPASQGSLPFLVQWSATDAGSGIKDFDVWVSDNGAPFTLFQTETAATSASFTGQPGHVYGFYSLARDAVGNVESPKVTADATTHVIGDATPPVIVPHVTGTVGNGGWYVSNVSVTWDVSDSESGITSSSGCAPVTLTADSVGTTLACSAINGVGMTSSSPITLRIDQTLPAITLTVSQPTVWPPNGKMISEVITGEITDVVAGIDPATTAFRVVDEYGLVQPDGRVTVMPDGTYSFSVMLEARRDGQDQDGRKYQIIVTASDKAGKSTVASTTVLVPHDQRR